ncbi:SDR family NAD(P)-dependent oxidoreductase [Rhodococcus xishaensis]|uniref:SDR family oxidoreductase n=1 Tax=Rhodococcus xishaensis TaxID=2487364 RepID=A0A3S3E338_9NOCA|nr:SDR family oxidoreductase [Rhodococcus xishaensis]RVW04252.1 SDR family oxidoreductase [Rhodococcus xishaensis]
MSVDVSGSTVLITGASAGLGSDFARRFAERGANLVLVARRADRLEELATEIRDKHSVSVTVLPMDLSAPGVAQKLKSELTARDIRIDSLVNNAGFGMHGDFASADLDRMTSAIQLNVTTLVELSHVFLPDLLRGRGLLMNIASSTAYQPVPGMAVYAATKAFVLHFTEALWAEARGTGLTVLAVSPGPTHTEFFDVVGTQQAAAGHMQTAEQVMNTTFRTLDRRNPPPSVMSGWTNKLSALGPRLGTRRITALVVSRMLGNVRMRASIEK